MCAYWDRSEKQSSTLQSTKPNSAIARSGSSKMRQTKITFSNYSRTAIAVDTSTPKGKREREPEVIDVYVPPSSTTSTKRTKNSLLAVNDDDDYDDFQETTKPIAKTKKNEAQQTQLYMPKKREEAKKNELIKPKKREDPKKQEAKKPEDLIMTIRINPSRNNPFRAAKPGDTEEHFKQGKPEPLFVIPKKLKSKASEMDMKKSAQVFNELRAMKTKEEEYEGDKDKCPYCFEILFPMQPLVKKALEHIKRLDEEYNRKRKKEIEEENANSSFIRPLEKRPVNVQQKDEFCNLHYREIVVKLDGHSKDYPETIDFSKIGDRMKRFDAELKDVISNKIMSDYRTIAEDAYKEQGATKARSAMSVMNRFESSLPGYYGPKGAAVILGVLSTRYLKSGYLVKNLVSQQLPLEFLQQVLVPEAGFRLIRQDIMKTGAVPNATTKAKEIMTESREYGNAVFPAEDAEIEEMEIENPLYIGLSDEEHFDSENDDL